MASERMSHTCVDRPHLPCAACEAGAGDGFEYPDADAGMQVVKGIFWGLLFTAWAAIVIWRIAIAIRP